MTVRRRKRGTLIDPVSLGYAIERPTKESFDRVALNVGISGSALMQAMIERLVADELTDQGIPTWWTPLPRDEELPINPD